MARSLHPDRSTPGSRRTAMLTLAMIVLGLATFAAMLGFVALCERV
jgi:hypothetical protein